MITPDSKPTVIVEKCADYNRKKVEAAVKTLFSKGKFSSLLKKNAKVLVQPNCLSTCTPDQAVTTHPEVVRAICKELQNLGQPFRRKKRSDFTFESQIHNHGMKVCDSFRFGAFMNSVNTSTFFLC